MIIYKNKKLIKIFLSIFIFLLFIWNNIIIFNDFDEVVFLDLPQGEATLIKKAFNRCNILIDTGGIIKYEEDWKKRNGSFSLSDNTIS